jgi:hypothetical protein
MTLRKILPAALLLLAACSSQPTPAATESVGMDSSAKKACCTNMTAEEKAQCPMQKMECCEKEKAAADAAKP